MGDRTLRHTSNLLPPTELASALSVPVSTIYYWTSRHEIPFIKVGRHLRFNLSDVLAHLESRTREQNGCNAPMERLKSGLSRSLKTKTGQVVPDEGSDHGNC